MILSDDAWVHIGLHLKPRHLSKLMRTCKRIKRLVDNETYWTRVAAHQVWRELWLLEMTPPCEAYTHPSPLLPIAESGLYYMVGLDKGYYWSMECFIQRIQDSLDVNSRNDDEDDRDFINRYQTLSLKDKTIKLFDDRRSLEENTMKAIAKSMTVFLWVTCTDDLVDKWPKLREFLCDLEDDPMPVVYKRRVLSNMRVSIGSGLSISVDPGKHAFIDCMLFIF